MTLEHLGIAVRDVEAVKALYARLLGLAPYKTETVEREGVRTHFLDAGAKLELLEALGPESPVARHLDKRGEGLHHVAFRVDDVDAAFAHARALGLTPLADAPRPGADGKRIFFLHPRDTHGVLVELCGDAGVLPPAVEVPFDGTTLAAYAFGDPAQPPLLLLHGAAGATRLETLPLARELERDFHVVAFDYEGHGASGAARGALTLGRLASMAEAVAEHFALARPHLVGFSLGGAVALRYAHRHPERAGRVAVHATNLAWDEALVQAMNARLRPDVLQRRYPDVWARFEEAHGGRTEAVFAAVRAMTETLPALADRLPELRALAAPVLVSAGDRDELFGLDRTLALYHLFENAHLAVLPGLRHALGSAEARVLAPVLRPFLRQD